MGTFLQMSMQSGGGRPLRFPGGGVVPRFSREGGVPLFSGKGDFAESPPYEKPVSGDRQ